VAPAQAFIAMHWGSEVLGGLHRGGVNALTSPAVCPQSKQPELKHAAVQLTKAALPWQLMARSWLPPDQALERRAALLAACSTLDFAACMPFGREPGPVGVLLRAAAPAAPPAAWLAQIEALLGLDAPDVLHYADTRQGQRRSVRMVPRTVAGATTAEGQPAGTRVQAFLLSGNVQAAGWITALLLDELPAQAYGRALLAGTATPPVAVPARGAQVCNCFDVTEPEITGTLARCSGSPEARLAQLQAQLRCGTQCGSCLPALRRLVQTSHTAADTALAAGAAT
jgi:assimilatory nitrate reductase catalytic subunit